MLIPVRVIIVVVVVIVLITYGKHRRTESGDEGNYVRPGTDDSSQWGIAPVTLYSTAYDKGGACVMS